ncbi:MAG: hypothetical protein A2934_05185 [Candidatus Sungbacteria bacterium RIFCSPLOWO2_01_FULL_47_10]|uniref:Uncharacterized protein n=1 Tax=Candidatus Sungbacteria bacterium RIFCSPLOWO2_01_FULL_47_10 TaxID=1802276 RepID=A0A1G2L3R6_9BACT|nr:MAG: hypothetical protein A2934_05185 [Candidatus Sungbacteria bacterium RIFCSPLOWO2_01_FULL_47_10]
MTSLILRSRLSQKNIDDYKPFSPKTVLLLKKTAKKFRGKAIIHINATAHGGGVVEILKSQVPLERSLGLKSYWLVIKAKPSFYEITKKIHNLLHGKEGGLTEGEKKEYIAVNKALATSFRAFCGKNGISSGIVIVHDPQPLGMIHGIPKEFFPVLRLHIDLLTPNVDAVRFFEHSMDAYPVIVVSNAEYINPLSAFAFSKKIFVLPPALDPLSEKNVPMTPEAARMILAQFNINYLDPIVTQVSRFDPWKDPMGVIQAYYIAKNSVPNLQLVLAGFIVAKDDPEAERIFDTVKKHAKGDPDIFLFSDPRNLGSVSNEIFISALYTASSVVVQKSVREGFGLTMTEAMWKGKVVVAGDTSGGRLQIKNNRTGILVKSPEEAGRAIARLLKSETVRIRLGRAAHRSVARRFLLPIFLLKNIRLYCRVSGKKV